MTALRHWEEWLVTLKHFTIRTDHKNLLFFTQKRKLSERHMRWVLDLAKFNFSIQYIKGSTNSMADALSRRDQDMPQGEDDPRIKDRTIQLLDISQFQDAPIDAVPVTVNLLQGEE